MPTVPPVLRRAAMRAAFALLIGCSAGTAGAAPDAAADAASDKVLKLLAEHGFAAEPAPSVATPPAGEPGVLRRVHDRAAEIAVAAMDFSAFATGAAATRPRPASIAAASRATSSR